MKTIKVIGLVLFGVLASICLMAIGGAAWFAVFFARWAIYFGVIGLVIVALVALVIGTQRASALSRRTSTTCYVDSFGKMRDNALVE